MGQVAPDIKDHQEETPVRPVVIDKYWIKYLRILLLFLVLQGIVFIGFSFVFIFGLSINFTVKDLIFILGNDILLIPLNIQTDENIILLFFIVLFHSFFSFIRLNALINKKHFNFKKLIIINLSIALLLLLFSTNFTILLATIYVVLCTLLIINFKKS